MKNIYIVMAMLFTALFAAPAQAYYGATLEVTGNVYGMCPCDIISSNELLVEITNLGSSSDTYYMSLDLPEGWSGFVSPQMTLASAEKGFIEPLWITPACGTPPGTYEVTLVAESGMSGKTFERDIDIEILKCHDVSISADSSQGTCMDSNLETGIVIENRGKTGETFLLSSDTSWAVVDRDSVYLDPGESRSIALSVDPPEGQKGTYEVTVKAESEDSYASSSKTIRIDVSECYAFSTSITPSGNSVCMGDSAELYLHIDNLGSKADTYRIVTPSWVRAPEDIVSVGSMERRTVSMTATPLKTGEREITVYVSSENHATSIEEASVTLSAEKCSSVEVSMYPEKRSICSGDSAQFSVMVKNTGTGMESYSIDATPGSPSRMSLLLGPGDSENVIIDINTVSGHGLVPVSVSVTGDDTSASASSVLDVMKCHDASLDVDLDRNTACRGDMVSYDITVANTGEYEDSYRLSYPGGSEDFSLIPGETLNLERTSRPQLAWGGYRELEFTLESAGGFSETVRKKLVTNERSDCHDAEMKIKDSDDENVITVIGKGKNVEIDILNTGLRSGLFEFGIEGPEWAHLSAEHIGLRPAENGNVYLYLSPPFGTEEKEYEITVTASSEHASSSVVVMAVVASEENEEPPVQPPPTEGMFTGFDLLSYQEIFIYGLVVLTVAAVMVRFFFIRRFTPAL